MPCSSSSHSYLVNSQSSAKNPGSPHTRLGWSWACRVHSSCSLGLGRSRGPGPQRHRSVPSSALVSPTSFLQAKSTAQGNSSQQWGSKPAHRLGAQFHVLTQKRRHSHQNQPNCSWWDWNPKARPRKDLPLLGTLQHGSGGSPGSNLCVVWVRAEAWHGSDVSISHCIALWCGGGEWLQISRWSCLTLYLWLNMHWTKEEDWLTD